MLEILLEDLESFFRKEDEKEMVNDLRLNVVRNTKIFTEIVHRILPPRNTPISEEDVIPRLFRKSKPNSKTSSIFNDATTFNKKGFQPVKCRGFLIHLSMDCNIINIFSQVYIIFGPSSKIHFDTISELTSNKIGSLVVCKAIVLRASEIRP